MPISHLHFFATTLHSVAFCSASRVLMKGYRLSISMMQSRTDWKGRILFSLGFWLKKPKILNIPQHTLETFLISSLNPDRGKKSSDDLHPHVVGTFCLWRPGQPMQGQWKHGKGRLAIGHINIHRGNTSDWALLYLLLSFKPSHFLDSLALQTLLKMNSCIVSFLFTIKPTEYERADANIHAYAEWLEMKWYNFKGLSAHVIVAGSTGPSSIPRETNTSEMTYSGM